MNMNCLNVFRCHRDKVPLRIHVSSFFTHMWTRIGRIFVQPKVRIGTIPELYLRKVRIPTLSADSGIVLDNFRITQGVFY